MNKLLSLAVLLALPQPYTETARIPALMPPPQRHQATAPDPPRTPAAATDRRPAAAAVD